MTVVAVYGTFLRGQPSHAHLDGARPLGSARTAPAYRLWLVDGRWPALIPADDGVAIDVELYEVDSAHLARLAEVEPRGWSASPIELEDGGSALAFVGDRGLRGRGVDVSAAGGWAAAVSAGRGS